MHRVHIDVRIKENEMRNEMRNEIRMKDNEFHRHRSVPEDNDLIQSVEELWAEVLLKLFIDECLDAVVAAVLLERHRTPPIKARMLEQNRQI